MQRGERSGATAWRSRSTRPRSARRSAGCACGATRDGRRRRATRLRLAARDDAQGGRRRPRPRRRQGRDRAPPPRGSRDARGAPRLLDFGDLVESLGGGYITAEDVGTSPADMAVIAERTEPRHRAGETAAAPATRARSRRSAWRRPCARAAAGRFGDRRASRGAGGVVGLGHVGATSPSGCRGGRRADRLRHRRAKRAPAERRALRGSTPSGALDAECDVLAPCALGGVISAAERRPAALRDRLRRRQQPARRRAARGRARRAGDPLRARLHRERRRPDQRQSRDRRLQPRACDPACARDRDDHARDPDRRGHGRNHPARSRRGARDKRLAEAGTPESAGAACLVELAHVQSKRTTGVEPATFGLGSFASPVV